MPTSSSKERDRNRGKKLKQKRKEKNITQEQVAERLGMTTQAIRNMENGESWHQIDKISALCEYLDIDINQLANIDKLEKEEENSNSETVETSSLSKVELLNLIREYLETDEACIPISISMTEENIESYNSEV